MNYYADGGQAMATQFEEIPASQIIMNDPQAKEYGAEKVAQIIYGLIEEGKAVAIRHNNSILVAIAIGDGEAEVHLYTVDPPQRLASALKYFYNELLKSDVKRVYGTEMPDKQLIKLMLSIGAPIDKSDKPDYYWMASVQ
jgi:hypothetical protein